MLDGLEFIQEGPAGGQFGRLLDGTLRAVLTGACQQKHAGLVVPPNSSHQVWTLTRWPPSRRRSAS